MTMLPSRRLAGFLAALLLAASPALAASTEMPHVKKHPHRAHTVSHKAKPKPALTAPAPAAAPAS